MKVVNSTDDYSMFKTLKGNRDIGDDRVDRIIKSIAQVGYITNPIIVNERMEVIDGQGRLEALRILGLPVEYIVHEGAGIEECRALNINQKNWTMKDYAESYAKTGNLHYTWLLRSTQRYGHLGLELIASVASEGTVDRKGAMHDSS